MVRIIEGKLIIEIETSNPVENFVYYQNAILDVLQSYTEDFEEGLNSEGGGRTTAYF